MVSHNVFVLFLLISCSSFDKLETLQPAEVKANDDYFNAVLNKLLTANIETSGVELEVSYNCSSKVGLTKQDRNVEHSEHFPSIKSKNSNLFIRNKNAKPTRSYMTYSYHQLILANTGRKEHSYISHSLIKRSLSAKLGDVDHEMCYGNNSCTSGSQSNTCSCNVHTCGVYGDCCRDVNASSLLSRTRETSVFVHCQGLKSFDETVFLKLINKCPLDSSKSIVSKCTLQPKTTDDVDAIIPVYSNSSLLTYKNRYCAQCHGEIGIDIMRFDVIVKTSFKKSNHCPIENIAEAYNTNGCSLGFEPPPDSNGVSYCYKNIYEECSSSWSETYINSSRNIWTSISDLCEDDGQAILKVEGNYFRNIYCAICNNVIHNDGVCQEGVMAYPDMFGYKGLKVLIDTSLESNAEKSRSNLLLPPADGHDHNCTGGIYDHFFDTCRNISCRFGYVLHNYECKMFIKQIQDLSLIFNMYLVSDNMEQNTLYNLLRLHNKNVKLELQYNDDVTVADSFVSNIKRKDSGNTSMVIRLAYLTRITWPHNFYEYIDQLETLARTSWNASSEDFEHLQLTRISHENLCSSFEISDVCEEGYNQFISKYYNFDSLFQHELSCPFINIESSDTETKYQIILKFLEQNSYGYLLKSNESLHICKDDYMKMLRNMLYTGPNRQFLIDFILTYCAFGISTLSLALFIIMHLRDRSFRTIGGKNIMALAVSLILAQLLFMVGIDATEFLLLCQVIGVCLHFLWTNVFCWMIICAFGMWRSLRSNYVKQKQTPKVFLRNIAISVFSSLCNVIPMAVLHFTGIDLGNCTITYGGSACFLSTVPGLLIGVFVPLGVMLITTTAFFLHFLLFIKKHTKETSNLLQKRSYLFMFVKMSTLFGFGWAFGILANFFRYNLLWYTFYVLTGLQGFFLTIAFTRKSKIVSISGSFRSRSVSNSVRRSTLTSSSRTRASSVCDKGKAKQVTKNIDSADK